MDYQKIILDSVPQSTGNILIQAVAGSGKTSTLVALAKQSPSISGLAIAFNRSIADDFSVKFPPQIACRTLHAEAFQILKQGRAWRVNERKTENILKYKLLGYEEKKNWKKEDREFFYLYREQICKLVSLAKGENLNPRLFAGEISRLAETYHVDLPENGDCSRFEELTVKTYALSLTSKNVIDFDDMLQYPFLLNLEFPKYDIVYVDEAQDMNAIQRAFIQKISKRAIIVGDENQAIYGFRGACPDSMKLFEKDFSCTVFPLSCSFRCSQAVIQEAKKIVPQIEAREDAKLGQVNCIERKTLSDFVSSGDLILCRTNLPLVEIFLKLLELGKPSKILGKDYLSELSHTAQQVRDQEKEVSPRAISAFWVKEQDVLRAKRKFYLLDQRQEIFSILLALSGSYTDYASLTQLLYKIFSQTDTVTPEQIILSSIHKAKGLEAKRVFILPPGRVPEPKTLWEVQQEKNLQYVAITRAREELYYVQGE